MRIRITLLAGACVVGLVAAACGDSSSGAPASSAAATAAGDKAAFVERVNAVRGQSSDRAMSSAVPGDPATATAEQLPAWSDYVQQILPPLREEQASLRAVPPPSGDADTIDTILTEQTTAIGNLEMAQRAAASGEIGSRAVVCAGRAPSSWTVAGGCRCSVIRSG
jgi:hypothetical protein